MKKTSKIFKKLISGMSATAVLISSLGVMPIFAVKYSPRQDTTTPTIIGYNPYNSEASSAGGKLLNMVNWINKIDSGEAAGDKAVATGDAAPHAYAMKLTLGEKNGQYYTPFYLEGNRAEYDSSYSKYSIGFDFKIANYGQWQWIFNDAGKAVSSSGGASVAGNVRLFSIVFDENGKVGLYKNGPTSADGNLAFMEENYYLADYELNKWHQIRVVIDKTKGDVTALLDGTEIGTINYHDFYDALYPSGWTGLTDLCIQASIVRPNDATAGGPYTDASSRVMYVDEITAEYIIDDGFYGTAQVSGSTITVNLSQASGSLNASDIAVKKADGTDALVDTVELDGKTITITLSETATGEYVVCLPENLNSNIGQPIYCPEIFAVDNTVAQVKTISAFDMEGEEFGPITKTTDTVNKIKVFFTEESNIDGASISESTITLKNSNDTPVDFSLSNYNSSEKSVTLTLDKFLPIDDYYNLKVSGVTSNGTAIPEYTGRINVTAEGSFISSDFKLVSAGGTEITSIALANGTDIYADVEFFNTTKNSDKRLLTIAAYKEENDGLRLTAINTEMIDISAASIVDIAPDKTAIKLSVPLDADVVKAYMWNSDTDFALASDVIKLGTYTARTPEAGKEGVLQNENGSLSLFSNIGKANDDVSVAVYKKGTTYGDTAVYTDIVRSTAGGNVAIYFSVSALSGRYTAIVTASDGTKKEYDFGLVSQEEYTEVSDYIDGVVSDESMADEDKIDAIKGYLESGYASYAISDELFSAVSTEAVAILLLDKLETDEISLAELDMKSGAELVNQAFVIQSVAEGDIENVFDYSYDLMLDESENWEWYTKDFVTESVQKEITSRLTGAHSSEREFNDAFEEAYVLSVVHNPDGVGNLREVLQHFYEEIGIDAKGKDSTYQSLVGDNYSSYEALKQSFDELEFDLGLPGGGNHGGGSGGSGGSSGGGGGAAGSNKNNTNINEFETDVKDQEKTEPEPILDDIFDDLEGYDWAKQAIVFLAEKRIVTGKEETKFCPGDLLTREEFAAMLVRAFASDIEASGVSFTDAKSGEWYNEYLGKAVSAGIVKGYDDGRFGLGECITRQDMVVMLSRAAEYAGIVTETEDVGTTFADDKQISDYAKDAVYAMRTVGIVNGVTFETFAPMQFAGRAQAAKVIFGLFNI